jgi:hypothetical protein
MAVDSGSGGLAWAGTGAAIRRKKAVMRKGEQRAKLKELRVIKLKYLLMDCSFF